MTRRVLYSGIRMRHNSDGRSYPNCGLMLLYDVIRWWTLGVQAFKCRTETIQHSLDFLFHFRKRSSFEPLWHSIGAPIDRCENIFSFIFNQLWLSSRPPVTNQNEKSINRWNVMLSVPRPRDACVGAPDNGDVYPNSIVFIDVRTKKRNQLTIFLSEWRTAQSTMPAYLVGSKSMDKSGFFVRHENENGKNHKNRYLFSIFVFYLVMTLSLTNVHNALRWWYAPCDITRTHNVYIRGKILRTCRSNQVLVVCIQWNINGNAFEIEPARRSDKEYRNKTIFDTKKWNKSIPTKSHHQQYKKKVEQLHSAGFYGFVFRHSTGKKQEGNNLPRQHNELRGDFARNHSVFFRPLSTCSNTKMTERMEYCPILSHAFIGIFWVVECFPLPADCSVPKRSVLCSIGFRSNRLASALPASP